MCRWLAYTGAPILLHDVLFKTEHSLIDQSLHAEQNVETTNGDGFGVAWYDGRPSPGVCKDVHPAWNDRNLLDLANHIESPLFMAHIRAATGTPIQRSNCHPFRHENWVFQHNGVVPEFARVKRDLALDVDPSLFSMIEGSTDSELLFFLGLTYGLQDDAQVALSRVIDRVERARADHGVAAPLTFSVAASDGERVLAVRYASHGPARTLYHSLHADALCAICPDYPELANDTTLVVSEPLDRLQERWREIPNGSFVEAQGGGVRVSALEVTA